VAEHHDQQIAYKTYFMTWVWLLVLTALALGLGYAPINERWKAVLLV
jgi:cytochrome c oxidase subunit IV